MKTTITSHIYIENPTEEIKEWCQNNLVLSNPVYELYKRQGKNYLLKSKHITEKIKIFYLRYNTIVLPFGCLKSIWNLIKDFPYTTSFNENECISIKDEQPKEKLFDYQEKALKVLIESKGGVLKAPCGSGKTYIGIELIRRLGKKTLWLCHTSDLLNQTKKKMLAQYPNIKIGITTAGNLEIGEDITIATVQTLSKINPEFYKNEFDVIVCDEAAHVVSEPTNMRMFGEVLSNVPARYKFGLTATPNRSDGMIKSMYAYIGTNEKGEFKPVYEIKKEEIKKEVSLMETIHQKVEIATYYDDVSKLFEIYDNSGMLIYNKLIDSLINNEMRNDIIVDNIVKCDKEGRKQVVLSKRVSHCEELTRKLCEKNVNAVLCIGKTKDREDILTQKKDWNVLVATLDLLKEGISINELDTLHIVTPISDKSAIIQCVGRIERYCENKKQPIFFDYVDIDIPYCEKKFKTRKSAIKNR